MKEHEAKEVMRHLGASEELINKVIKAKGTLRVDFKMDSIDLFLKDDVFKDLVEHFKSNVLHVVLRTEAEKS